MITLKQRNNNEDEVLIIKMHVRTTLMLPVSSNLPENMGAMEVSASNNIISMSIVLLLATITN